MGLSLGLDISTSCTGWSLLRSDESLHSIGYIRLGSYETIFQKAQSVKKELLEINKNHNIEKIYIEQSLKKSKIA